MRLSVGDKLTLFTKTRFSGSNAGTFRVTGIVHFPVFVFNQKSFFLPIDVASELLQLGDMATEILVLVKNEDNLSGAASGISAILKDSRIENAIVERWNESDYVFAYIQLINVSFLFLSLFFFLLGTTVIVNTTMMVIYERMREIGTISAMGMTGGEIVRLFFLEAFYISAIAAFAGVVLGYVAVQILSVTGLNLELLGRGINMEFSSIIYPSASPLTALFVYIYAVAVSSLVSLVPSRHASRIEPVEALRSV
jgi:putative ABC transport system permease protein